MNIFLLREAIASVALSHPENCGCDTCLAAGGDEEAFKRVVVRQMRAEEARPNRPHR